MKHPRTATNAKVTLDVDGVEILAANDNRVGFIISNSDANDTEITIVFDEDSSISDTAAGIILNHGEILQMVGEGTYIGAIYGRCAGSGSATVDIGVVELT